MWDALRASARNEPSPVLKDNMYHLLASARDETLAQRALDIAISDEPGATLTLAMVRDVAEEHPDLAFSFALANLDRLNARVSDSMRARFYPGLATTSNDRGMVDKIDRFAKASIPAGSRQSAERVMAQVGFRADVVRQRLQRSTPGCGSVPEGRAARLGAVAAHEVREHHQPGCDDEASLFDHSIISFVNDRPRPAEWPEAAARRLQLAEAVRKPAPRRVRRNVEPPDRARSDFSTSPRVKRPPKFLSGGVFTQARPTAKLCSAA